MRRILAAASLLLALHATALHAEPAPVVKTPQTIVTLAPGVDNTLDATPNRHYLCLMNLGPGEVSLGFDQAAVAGQGWPMDPPATAGNQGGWVCWEGSQISGSIVHGISTTGATVAVLVGK
jgi:hypothetical protein